MSNSFFRAITATLAQKSVAVKENVVDKEKLSWQVGGVKKKPVYPSVRSLSELDVLLKRVQALAEKIRGRRTSRRFPKNLGETIRRVK